MTKDGRLAAMQQRGEVYIIILNWNGLDDTIACVNSCLDLEYPAFRILVVDNGSTDGSMPAFRDAFYQVKNVQFLETGENLGFAGGNNAGIRVALEQGADMVWLLNNDTVVHPQALTALVDAAARHPEKGIFGSKIYLFDPPNVIWHAGGVLLRDRFGAPSHIGYGETDEGQYDEERDVDYITGCSLLFRRDLVDKIGLMSEDYFLYWEEVDYNTRAHEAGLTSLYVPGSVLWHKVSASFNGGTSLQTRYDIRNRLLFHKRHFPRRVAPIVFWIAAAAARNVLHRDFRLAGALLRGELDFLLGRTGKIGR